MIGRILKKTLGITLIEALISLSLISTVAITGTNFYIDIKKNDLLNIETKRIESVIKGLDKRFELEGYSSLLWQQDMSGNTNEEVGNILSRALVSEFNRECGLADGWTPQYEEEKDKALIACDLLDFNDSRFFFEFDLNVDPNKFINSGVLLVTLSEPKMNEEAFKENLEDLISVKSKLDSIIGRSLTGLREVNFVESSSPNNKISLIECIEEPEKCAINATWARSGDFEQVRIDGKNSILNDHVSFRENTMSDPLVCNLWIFNNETGEFEYKTNEKCGLGVYEKQETASAPFIRMSSSELTLNGMYLNSLCNSYNVDTNGYLFIEEEIACGVYEKEMDGDTTTVEVVTLTNTMDVNQLATIKDLVVKTATASEIKNNILNVFGDTTITTLKVNGESTFNADTNFGNVLINKNLKVGKQENADDSKVTNLKTLKTKKEASFLDNISIEGEGVVVGQVDVSFENSNILSTTNSKIGDRCNISEKNSMVIQKAEGIVIVCKLNERITKASGVTTYTWQSNKIGEISPFNNSCPSGWRELEEAKGRFLVGAGEIEEKILNSEIVDEFGKLDYSKMSTVTQKYKLGAIGGKSYIQLKEDQLPNHDHSSPNVDHVILAMDSAQGKAGNVQFKAHENVIGSVKEDIRTQNSISKYDLHTNTAGSDKSHENRPSYYSVVWCISEEPDEEINASIETIFSDWVDYPALEGAWYNIGDRYDCTTEVEEQLNNPSRTPSSTIERVRHNKCKQDQEREIIERQIKYTPEGNFIIRNKTNEFGTELKSTEERTIWVKRAWVEYPPSYTPWVDYGLPFNCANDGVVIQQGGNYAYRRTCDQKEERYRQHREIEIGTEEIRNDGDPIREERTVRKHVFQEVTPAYVNCANWVHHSYSGWSPNLNNYYARDSIRQARQEKQTRQCSYYGTISTGETIQYKVETEIRFIENERYMPGNKIVLYINDIAIRDAAYTTTGYVSVPVYSDARIPNNGINYSFSLYSVQGTAKEYDSTQNSDIGAAGDVRMSTYWPSGGDIDSWVRDPCGGWISYMNRNVTCNGKTGVLDVDDLTGGKGENVTYPSGAPEGTYMFCLHNYSGNARVQTTKIWLGNNITTRTNFGVTSGAERGCSRGTYITSGYYDPYARYDIFDYEKYNSRRVISTGATQVNTNVKLYGGKPNEPREHFYMILSNPSPAHLIEIRDSMGVIYISK